MHALFLQQVLDDTTVLLVLSAIIRRRFFVRFVLITVKLQSVPEGRIIANTVPGTVFICSTRRRDLRVSKIAQDGAD